MLSTTSKILLSTAAIAAAVSVMASSDADARRRWNTIDQCQPAVEGAATSQGILGLGSARARRAAQSNWEINVEDQYGPAYANFAYARNVQWDCKKGAVILAKCVVVAKPCRARLRG